GIYQPASSRRLVSGRVSPTVTSEGAAPTKAASVTRSPIQLSPRPANPHAPNCAGGDGPGGNYGRRSVSFHASASSTCVVRFPTGGPSSPRSATSVDLLFGASGGLVNRLEVHLLPDPRHLLICCLVLPVV
ncbi:hypothetical protein BgiMline_025498, partial [Biomphalaria glabrata]